MEWKVQNALNRDVERQHLNKILKEIEGRISDIKGQTSPDEITRVVERVIRTESPDALTSVTVNLTGDVTGQGTSTPTGRVNINVVIDPSKLGITDAPVDNSYYWRINGTWEPVSDAVSGLQDIVEPGVLVYTGGEPAYRSLIVEGVEDEVVVENGNGQDLDLLAISIGLAKIELVAGETIHSLRAVMAIDGEAFHPDTSISQDSLQVVGVSLTAGETNDTVVVRPDGRITEGSWSWTPGPIYCGDEGVLTQSPSNTEWILQVGRAISPTTIEVAITLPILRN